MMTPTITAANMMLGVALFRPSQTSQTDHKIGAPENVAKRTCALNAQIISG